MVLNLDELSFTNEKLPEGENGHPKDKSIEIETALNKIDKVVTEKSLDQRGK